MPEDPDGAQALKRKGGGFMKRTAKRLVVFALCAALLASGLAAACLAGHRCEGEDCPICLMIQAIVRPAALCPPAAVLSALVLRTARAGAPFIKRFAEERELTVVFMVDVSGSQSYGSGAKSKMELSAEVTSLLALTAIRNQDKIGLILFSDRIVKYIPPRKGRQSVMRLVREVLASEDGASGGTDLAGALRFFDAVEKRKAVVFLVSDFLGVSRDEETAKLLRVASRKHDFVCVPVSDPAESALPDAGLVQLEDPETGLLALVDTSDRRVREAFAAAAAAENDALASFFARNGIDRVDIATDRPYIQSIRALFKRRAKKR